MRSLLLMGAAPAIWVVHFLLCYLTGAIWCAKVAGAGGSLGWVPLAVAGYTAAAVAGILAVGWLGFRWHDVGSATVPHDYDTPEDRHRFIGFSTVLLAGLSLVGVLYVGLAALWFERCL